MRNASLAALLAAMIGGVMAAGPAVAGTSPAEEAGATAGLAVACDPTDPDLREFIRQSMATIEARSRSPEELERNMAGFVDAFARSAFIRTKPAACARLADQSQRVYRSLGGTQALVLGH